MNRTCLAACVTLAAIPVPTAAAKSVTISISKVTSSTVENVPAGAAMADAGDVNGDGLHDLIIGGGPAGLRSSSNSAFIVFGHRKPFTVDLRSLGRNGIRIDGAALGDGTGAAVAAAGDVDGDGLGDVLVGAPERGDGAGSVYVIRGRRSSGAIDLSDDSAALQRIDGTAASHFGASVAAAGDVDGDGVADLLIGAPYQKRLDGPAAGGAWVIFGRRPAGGPPVSVASLGDRALLLEGAHEGDLAGSSVAGLGDLNGDHHADVAVGAPSAFTGQFDSGQGVVSTVFGRGAGVVDLGALGRSGFRVVGDYGGTGTAIAGVGDVNGDGTPDLGVTSYAVGSDGDYGGGSSSAVEGAAIVFGSLSTADVALSDPVPRFVRLFDGRRDSQPTVARVGDLNRDGRADVLAGGADKNGVAAAYLRYGATRPKDGYDVRFTGARNNSIVGVAVTGLGDLNGDQRPELVFATGGRASSPGMARIVYGFGKPTGNCANTRKGTSKADDIFTTGVGDRVVAGAGNDHVTTFGGNDCIDGGPGNDVLSGGAGNDRITGGSGRDTIIGGDGNDTINARDGEVDTVRCGAGHDVVTADKRDKLSGCEVVK